MQRVESHRKLLSKLKDILNTVNADCSNCMTQLHATYDAIQSDICRASNGQTEAAGLH